MDRAKLRARFWRVVAAVCVAVEALFMPSAFDADGRELTTDNQQLGTD